MKVLTALATVCQRDEYYSHVHPSNASAVITFVTRIYCMVYPRSLTTFIKLSNISVCNAIRNSLGLIMHHMVHMYKGTQELLDDILNA